MFLEHPVVCVRNIIFFVSSGKVEIRDTVPSSTHRFSCVSCVMRDLRHLHNATLLMKTNLKQRIAVVLQRGSLPFAKNTQQSRTNS
jgi:hypothetical protein